MSIYDVGYGGFGAFQNNFRIDNIPKVEQVKPIEEVKPAEPDKQQPKALDIVEVDDRPRRTDPNSVSLDFNKGNDHSYIGSTKDIEKLDVAKAISAMQQDSVLQEYNYFVGSSDKIFSSEDGVVIAK